MRICGWSRRAVILISRQEPLDAEDGAELGAEDLEGDLAVVLEVGGEEDRRHAAGAELALDAVALLERGGEATEVAHPGLWGDRGVWIGDAVEYRCHRARRPAAPHIALRRLDVGMLSQRPEARRPLRAPQCCWARLASQDVKGTDAPCGTTMPPSAAWIRGCWVAASAQCGVLRLRFDGHLARSSPLPYYCSGTLTSSNRPD